MPSYSLTENTNTVEITEFICYNMHVLYQHYKIKTWRLKMSYSSKRQKLQESSTELQFSSVNSKGIHWIPNSNRNCLNAICVEGKWARNRLFNKRRIS